MVYDSRPRTLCATLALVFALGFACDAGERVTDPPHGPLLGLLSTVPQDGEGADCSPTDLSCGVPIDTPIRIRFDRLLLPSSIRREAIHVYTGTLQNPAPHLTVRYDVLTGELVFEFQAVLQRKALYQVELRDANLDGTGLRAFDGAPLNASGRALRWSFVTSGERRSGPAPSKGWREPTCDDVLRRLAPSCASGCCHGSPEPPMGLGLGDPASLHATAIGRTAHQAETGPTPGIPLLNPNRFGVAMPVIAPGSTENSYLVYKLLLSPDNLGPCESDCQIFSDFRPASACLPPSASERHRLRDWFVRGAPMPLDWVIPMAGCEAPRRLDCPTMRLLGRWIELGARCE